MKDLKNSILEKLIINKNTKIDQPGFNPKIPDKLYSNETLTCKEIIEKTIRVFGDYYEGYVKTKFKKEVNKLFSDSKNSEFNIIEWSGNEAGYIDEHDAIEALFPSESTYWDYDAEYYKMYDEETNGAVFRFISDDNRAICIVDTGDYGYCYVCVETK